jgi:molybdopterin converting factor subunit 1
MEIRIRLFAGLRDAAGTGNLAVVVADDARVADAVEALQHQIPAIKLPNGVAFALNQSYVTASAILRENDELALIPPVSGG